MIIYGGFFFMAKRLARQTKTTDINLGTGEISHATVEESIGIVDSEPPYIKIYVGTQLCLNNLDPNLAPYVIAFADYLAYANDEHYQHMIFINSIVRENVAKRLGVSIKRVDQITKKLVDGGVFIPIYRQTESRTSDGTIVEKRTKKKGVYFVNPWLVARGAWKDIRRLRQTIDFIEGTSSCTIATDETGELKTREIQVALPKKFLEDQNQKYHQMSLEDYHQQQTGESKK